MAYLNAASHGMPDAAVQARMIAYLHREAAVGPDTAEAEVAEELDQVRVLLARLVGADPDETAFAEWGTLAWNAVAMSIPLAGRRVLVAPGEWGSNVALLQRLGAVIEIMPVAPSGCLDIAAIAGRIDDDLAAICLPLVCSLTGEVYPVDRIGPLSRPDGCLLIVDAAQALGQMPVSFAALGCDVIVGPTRKWLRGPKGTGMLAVRRAALTHLSPSRMADAAGLDWRKGTACDAESARRFERSG